MDKKSAIITNELVKKYVSISDVIEMVEKTWQWHGENRVIMPPKITTDMSSAGVNGWFNSMPSYIEPMDSAGIKVVGGYSDNPKNGLPFIRSNLLLTDPHTGFLKALVCGDWISDARTGAQPAVAMKYLAAKSDVVTIIGAGRQAYYAVSCISHLHKMKELRVCDISKEARERFATYFPDADFAITPYADNEAACRESDVIITLTTADAVLVEEPWCKPGCLVMTMGSFHEVDDDIARKFDKLYLDHIAQGLHRGQFLPMAHRGEISAEDFAAELPEIVAGKKPGRENDEDRLMCELVGMGSPDLSIATLAFERIMEANEDLVKVDIGVGVFLSIKTGFLQFRKFGYMMKNTILSIFSKNQRAKDESGVSPVQAVATAMAGTIGTGSIAGLATAISFGGPGAIFWMWASALLGMVTKYSEIVLSLKFREKNANGEWVGGPMYYIKNGLGLKWLAALFAIFAMMACLGTGNATQSNSIAVALDSTLSVQPWITGIVLTVVVGAVILGGMRRIASVNEKLVPVMAVFFVTCSVVALIINIEKIPAAFALIFREAFRFKSAAGGIAGYGIMRAMQYGFSRGVFSNEAGLGSAPIAHAASSAKNPVQQGLWGMFEVFFTTIIICTLSGLVVLTAGLWNTGEFQGADLSIASFNAIVPGIGGVGVTLATVFFALSTILGWAYYGEVCIEYLFKNSKNAVLIYRCVYVAFVFIGAVSSLDLIWGISEMMNGLMIIPNLIGVVGLFKVVCSLTKEHFGEIPSRK